MKITNSKAKSKRKYGWDFGMVMVFYHIDFYGSHFSVRFLVANDEILRCAQDDVEVGVWFFKLTQELFIPLNILPQHNISCSRQQLVFLF